MEKSDSLAERPSLSASEISQARGILQDRGEEGTLPKERVFPIQIGSELFRLSGASISSDGPSYFTRFFQDQLREQNQQQNDGADNCPPIRTLYIDRDPLVFRDIARHLQGYHIKPLDGIHYVRLFADAQFYSLPRLMSQLFSSETFIQIGDRHFQVPRDIFSGADDTPNYFTLGFGAFFANPTALFPGLNRHGLLRPPSIEPPTVPTRSAEVFEQILHMLRGYPLRVRDEVHREELLRDVRYFHLRGLEQKLIPHRIAWDEGLGKNEIVVKLEDVKPGGVMETDESQRSREETEGWAYFGRSFGEDKGTMYVLTMEIGGDITTLDFINALDPDTKETDRGIMRLRGPLDERLKHHVIQKLAKRLRKVEQGGYDETVRFWIPPEAHVVLDGQAVDSVPQWIQAAAMARRSKKRKLDNGKEDAGVGEKIEWKVRNGQWRLWYEVIDKKLRAEMRAVTIEAFTGLKAMNAQRKFLR